MEDHTYESPADKQIKREYQEDAQSVFDGIAFPGCPTSQGCTMKKIDTSVKDRHKQPVKLKGANIGHNKVKKKTAAKSMSAISLEEMEILFDELTTAVPLNTWAAIVENLNERFGTSRLTRNVKAHWKYISRKKLLASYATETDRTG